MVQRLVSHTLIAALGSTLLTLSAPSMATEADFGRVVPSGAKSGDLSVEPCQITLEGDGRTYPGDCGTLVVAENRSNPDSRLIALPVRRINSVSPTPLEPIFWFEGGPGAPNLMMSSTAGLLEPNDFIMVGYRGLEGQVYLQCPEISDALRFTDGDYLGDSALAGYARAASACGERLKAERIDLNGYSMNQTIADNEAVRKAMGYERINLFGNSYGTRVQMLYQWQHPDSIHRNVMVAVNPPGHFLFDPASLEGLLDQYSKLCAKDAHCRSRTSDLFTTLQQVSQQMPNSWMGIDIDPQMVKFITNISLHESMQLPGEPPLNGPAAIDMWLDAAEGDSSGMALVSLIAPFILPDAFEWGHFLAMGGSAPDLNDPDRDYKTELTPDTIIGSPLSLFIWGIAQGWPETDDQSVGEVQESDVETLLISGTLDGSTPMQHARDELMPHLSKGHQVFIEDQAHAETFWHSQPPARAPLLHTFFDRGEVDDSHYAYQAPNFEVETSWGELAKIAMTVMVLIFGLAVALSIVIACKLVRLFAAGRSPPDT